jgi:hypothetical protein
LLYAKQQQQEASSKSQSQSNNNSKSSINNESINTFCIQEVLVVAFQAIPFFIYLFIYLIQFFLLYYYYYYFLYTRSIGKEKQTLPDCQPLSFLLSFLLLLLFFSEIAYFGNLTLMNEWALLPFCEFDLIDECPVTNIYECDE